MISIWCFGLHIEGWITDIEWYAMQDVHVIDLITIYMMPVRTTTLLVHACNVVNCILIWFWNCHLWKIAFDNCVNFMTISCSIILRCPMLFPNYSWWIYAICDKYLVITFFIPMQNKGVLARRLLNKELDPVVIINMLPNELKVSIQFQLFFFNVNIFCFCLWLLVSASCLWTLMDIIVHVLVILISLKQCYTDTWFSISIEGICSFSLNMFWYIGNLFGSYTLYMIILYVSLSEH